MRMLIRVTAEHIKKGKRGSATSCPVALAIKEVYGSASVGSDTLSFGTIDCITPRSVSEFVDDFDFGSRVEPFNFFLDDGK